MQTSENQAVWDKFAEKDAMYYVDTSLKNADQFWEKGRNNFQNFILPVLRKYDIGKSICIDFGCGIGRHTIPLAGYFEKVAAVDISPQMLKIAEKNAVERKISNIRFFQNNEFATFTSPVDFIYSANVFQHIEDTGQIESILRHLAKILKGYAYLQFDTRPKDWLYHIKNVLPDTVLPRSQRRGIRRIRRNRDEMKNLFEQTGFSVIEEQQPSSEYHFFILRKS